jgi:hypothetical protein
VNNLEARVFRLEQDVSRLRQQMDDVLRRLARLEQQAANGNGGMGGGGGSGYFVCTLSAALTHGAQLANQTVSQVDKTGTRKQVSTTATVVNDGPNAADDIASGKTVLLASNSDGSFTVIGVYC